MTQTEAAPESAEARMERMMTLHGQSLVRMCYVYLCDRESAKDAAQETFIKAYKSLDRFRGDCDEKTWLMRIAINTCRDFLRTSWFRRVDRRVTPDELPAASQEAVWPDNTVVEQIALLPAKYKEVVLLRYYQGLTLGQIAAALKLPQDTVKSRLGRAKDRLYQQLEGWYFDE